MRLFGVSSCAFLAGIVACGEIAGITDLDSTEEPEAATGPIDAGFDAGRRDSEPIDTGIADTAAADVDTGPSFRRVFVTSGAFMTDGNIGGVAKADGRCTDAAKSAGLASNGETWMAWISGDSTDAIARIQWNGPYQLLDGTPVVANKAQLESGTLLHAINRNEKNVAAEGDSSQQRVWTGTSAFGKLVDTCGNWTDNISQLGTYGRLSATDGAWTNEKSTTCYPSMRLYCFER